MDTVELNPENLNPNPTRAALSLSHPVSSCPHALLSHQRPGSPCRRRATASGLCRRERATPPRAGRAAAPPDPAPSLPSRFYTILSSLARVHRRSGDVRRPRAPQIRQHTSPAEDRNYVFFLPCSQLLRRWRAVGAGALVRRSSRRLAAATSSPCSRRLRRRRSRRTRGPSPPPGRTPSQRSISRRCQGPARRARTGRGPSRWNFIPFSFSFH
jgi:hypothetical protein